MKREIVVNGRFLSRRVTGVERYGREILSCIGGEYRLETPVLTTGGRIETTPVNGWRGHLWEQFVLPRRLDDQGILWSPANTGPLMIRNQALTLHDLSPLEHPEWFHKSFAAWYRLFLPILAKRVQAIFTPSEYVKSKVCKRFKVDNVTVTPNGVDPSCFHPSATQSKYDLSQKYVLFVGTLERRKNLAGLLKAWNEIRNNFQDTWLVVAGTSGNVFKPLKLNENTERVRFLGYVEDKYLPGLYAGATLFVLPSFEEGFGLPALEAMACGTPVLVANCGALCEVVREAGLVFDLFQDGSLSNTMFEYLANKTLRTSMREKGLARASSFSWQSTADLIWKTLHEI